MSNVEYLDMLYEKYQPHTHTPSFYWNDYNLGEGKDAYGINKLEFEFVSYFQQYALE